MSTLITRSTLVASALTTLLIGACAQTATPTPASTPPPATTPASVAVPPTTAATATDKAVPRADVGAVVQTGPSATEKMAPNMGMPASTDASMNADTAAPPPKPDRN